MARRMYIFWLSAPSTSYSVPMNEIFLTSPILTPRKLTELPIESPLTGLSEYVSRKSSPSRPFRPPRYMSVAVIAMTPATTTKPMRA